MVASQVVIFSEKSEKRVLVVGTLENPDAKRDLFLDVADLASDQNLSLLLLELDFVSSLNDPSSPGRNLSWHGRAQ